MKPLPQPDLATGGEVVAKSSGEVHGPTSPPEPTPPSGGGWKVPGGEVENGPRGDPARRGQRRSDNPHIPALRPRFDFDPEHPSHLGAASRQIARIVADGKWHNRNTIVDIVATDNHLQPETIRQLIYGMIAYGDLRRKGGRKDKQQIALTTRWCA